jgi:hypothetical protein
MSALTATLLSCRASYPVSIEITNKEADMDNIAISTLLFQAFATVTLVVGVSVSALFPARRAKG